MATVQGSNGLAHDEPRSDQPVHQDNAASSTSKPVEMDTLSPLPAVGAQRSKLSSSENTIGTETSRESQKPATDSSLPPTNPDAQQLPLLLGAAKAPVSTDAGADPPVIGPATDKPLPASSQPTTGPQLILTLLLHTGARHLFMINDKYLRKRNITVMDNNPINLSVYTLKELIWRDWRDDWDPRPSSPSSIRLIHYGKMLDDKSHLKEGRFSLGDAPHVVHMTVKPQEVVDDEDARIAKGTGRDRENSERTSGCRCAIL